MADRPTRATLPRAARIRSRRDFERVFARKRRAADGWIALHAGRSTSAQARLGIAAPRAVGSAVRRNRLKRLVREAFRRIRHELPPGTDWVVVLRAGPEPTIAQLQDSLRRLARLLLPKLDR